MDKLKGMTEYVLAQDKMVELVVERPNRDVDAYYRIVDYAKFLSQPLKLSFFVPCDEQGNVLEANSEAYQAAKERVLFSDCTFEKYPDHFVILNDDRPIWVSWNATKTIENLLWANLPLTEYAKKTINSK